MDAILQGPFKLGYHTNAYPNCLAQALNSTAPLFIPPQLRFTSTKVYVAGGRKAPEPTLKQPPKVVVDNTGKVKKEEPEKSFIAKYWMYILPIVVLFLLQGPAPEGGSGR
ncbi:hypothetical protein BT69DRAFT_1276592 [Atractiella rhizophila]|nr:hypothetical protein BT69DRAFT_1276592 [Atractiella rhizophila]